MGVAGGWMLLAGGSTGRPSGRSTIGQLLALLVVALIGLPLLPLLVLVILWIRFRDRARTR
jgi:hypothetical protein